MEHQVINKKNRLRKQREALLRIAMYVSVGLSGALVLFLLIYI